MSSPSILASEDRSSVGLELRYWSKKVSHTHTVTISKGKLENNITHEYKNISSMFETKTNTYIHTLKCEN